MLKNPYIKVLSLYLTVSMILLTLPLQGWAMFIPAGQNASSRQADMDAIQKTLESTMIKQRLTELGLSSGEALARINTMSDEQIHQLAANLDSLQAGGELGLLIFLLLVAILVVVILQASGHRVIIK